MAVAEYDTTLTLLTNAEAGTWGEFTNFTNGGTPDNTEQDFFIEGAGCTSQSFGTKTGAVFSIAFDSGAGQTFNTGDCLFIWQVCLAANGIDIYDNGGYRVAIGASLSDYNMWKTGGSDFGRNPYGGWQNVAVDPTFTPVDYTLGSPGAYQWFGSALNTIAQISKGSPHGVDVLRFGRGELIVSGGEAGSYGQFSAMATANDAQTARWGLFQEQGTGYLWKGLLTLGTSGTPIDMQDSNVNITADNAEKTYLAFNRIEINNVDSNIDWTAVNITALSASQLSPGQFDMIDDCSVTQSNCVFTDMDTFIYQSSASLDGTTFRRCNIVYQGNAIFTTCTFEEATGITSLSGSDSSTVTDSQFTSDGSSHAYEIDTAGSFSWTDNVVEGYAAVTGSTGNEVIYNTSGGAVTINVSGGSGTISYRNLGAATTTINSTVSVTLTGMRDQTEVRVLEFGTNTELAGIENATDGTVDDRSFSFSLSAATATSIKIHSLQYEHISIDYTIPSDAASIPIQQRFDRNYLNP